MIAFNSSFIIKTQGDVTVIIKRRQENICNSQWFYLVYLIEKDGEEVEVGRISWHVLVTLLGADNTYEEGLLAALRFVYGDVEIINE